MRLDAVILPGAFVLILTTSMNSNRRNNMLKKVFQAVLAAALFLVLSTEARAIDTVIKVDLGGTGPDVALTGATFGTVNDGDAGTVGDQTTGVDFVGPLSFLADILSGASFSLGGVNLVGSPTVFNGTNVFQATNGGNFGLWDSANTLLLSGTLAGGSIAGTIGGTTGSFFHTTVFSYTGGSLLAYIQPTPAGLSLALSQITSGQLLGLQTLPCEGITQCTGNLAPFTANASGLLEGTSVPEPASMLLLVSGLFGGLVARRKRTA
jgi:hypothetical protein